MRIALAIGKRAALLEMSTDNGIPRIGDVVEYEPNLFGEVTKVTWKIVGPPEPGYITHQAVIQIEPRA